MSSVNQKQFLNELNSGMVYKIYYFYGNDTAQVLNSTNALIKKIMGDSGNDFVKKYDGTSSVDINELSDSINMYPFGCQYNCIVINDWNCEKKKADENDKLLKTLKNDLNDTTVLIFNATGFDVCDGKTKPTAKNKKLIDFADKNGVSVVCNIKDAYEMSADIMEYAKSKNCSISRKNAELVATDCLCQSDSVYNEMDKLCTYTLKGEIKQSTIEKLVTKQENMKIYALTNAINSGNENQIMHNYNVLKDELETEQILFMLSDTFILWYRAKSAIDSGISPQQVQSDFGYRFSFQVTNAFRDCRKFSSKVLKKCIIILRDTQKRLNSMSKINKNAEVELALVKIIKIMKGKN